MSKTYSNSNKVERIKEPLFQVNRIKFRGPRDSQLENVETNLLKIDLARIENELDSIDNSILDDITLLVGDIEDINTSVLLDDGLSYTVSDVRSYVDSSPSVFYEAVLWLDTRNSVSGETSMSNLGLASSTLNAAYNGSAKLLTHSGENYLYTSSTTGNYAILPYTDKMNILGVEGSKFLNLTSLINNYAYIGNSSDFNLLNSNVEFVFKVNLKQKATSYERLIIARPYGYGYFVAISPNGQITLGYTVDSAPSTIRYASSVVNTVEVEIPIWIRVTRDWQTGIINFYTSPNSDSEPSNWNFINSINGYVGSFISNSYNLGIGGPSTAANWFGDIHRVIIRNQTNGYDVADVDFTSQSISTRSFIESTGKTVTLIGPGTKIVDGSTYLFSAGVAGAYSYIDDPDTLPNHLDILGIEGTKFLSLPGTTGNYASTPDVASLDVTGDIELVMRLSLDDWTPSPSNKYSFSKRAAGTNQRSWLVEHVTTGAVRLYWSADGINDLTALSTANLSALANGQVIWLKITLDVDNGASGNDVKFWWATDQATEPTSWTQLGATVTTAGVTSIFNSTARLQIGGWEDGGTDFGGKFYRAIVRNGIGGTAVFDANFTSQTIGTTSFTESTGKLVTINGSVAKIVDGTTYLYNDSTTVSTTATQATVGATTIVVASATGLAVGQRVLAPTFISDDTYITLISSTTVTISRPTIAAMSATSVSFRHDNYVSVPDNAALNFTGDLELVCRLAPKSWTPSSTQIIMGKGYGQQYYLYLTSTSLGAGITVPSATPSTIFPSITWTTGKPTIGGTPMWIKYTRNATTGANTFYYYTDQEAEPTAAQWITIGTAAEATAGVMATSAQPFSVGAGNNGSTLIYSPIPGRIMRAIVRNGIDGTKALDLDFTRQIQFATSFIENSSNGLTATLNGGGCRIERERNVDISIRLQLNSLSAQQAFISKDGGGNTVGGYHFGMGSTSTLFFRISDGTTIYQYNGSQLSTVGLILGKKYWLRVTFDAIDATLGSVVRFYYAEDQFNQPTGASWKQIGSEVSIAGAASIAPNQRAIGIGAYSGGGADAFNGKIYRAIIENGIDGPVVVDVDYTRQIQFATDFVDHSSYQNYVAVGRTTVSSGTGVRVERKRNLELVCRVAADDWTPAAESYIFGKYNTAATGPFIYQRSYAFSVATTGRLTVRFSPDGFANINPISTVIPDFVNGTTYWLKATVDTDNGLASSVTNFYYADDQIDEPTSWTQIGGPSIVANASSIFPTSSFLEIGTISSVRNSISTPVSAGQFAGKIFRTIVRNGIDGESVADVDFTKEIVDGSQNYLSVPQGTESKLNDCLQLNNLGYGGYALNPRSGSFWGLDNTAAITTNATLTTDPKWLSHTGTNYLYLPGSGNNYASYADDPSFDILGDIDISCRVSLNTWISGAAATSGITSDLVVRDNGDPNRSYRFYVDTNGRLAFTWYPSGSVASAITKLSTVPVNFINDTPYWLRVTLDVDNGNSGNDLTFWWAADQSSEPTIWNQLGAKIVTSGVTSFPATNAGIFVGGTISPPAGKFYRQIIKNGINGTKILDIDFTTAISAANQTSFTDSTGKTVTITRTTSGKKAVAVHRPCWMFGANSYMEIYDNGLLDFDASDSFTTIAVVRQWGTAASSGRYICKGGSGATKGWAFATNAITIAPVIAIGDGATGITAVGATQTAGTFNVFGGIVDRSAQTIRGFVNNSLGATTSIASIGSCINSNSVRIGANGSSLINYQDFELFAALIFRKALTSTEIALINSHYSGTITSASEALLSSAVFYLDAAKATQSGAIVRHTSGRKAVAVTRPTILLGSNDYLRIEDSNILDFAEKESFSMLISFRQWNAPTSYGRLFSKSDNSVTSGYELYNNVTDDTLAFSAKGDTGSGSGVSDLSAQHRTMGRLANILVVRNTSSDKFNFYVDTTLNNSSTDNTTGTLANSYPLTIGTRADVLSGNADFEFYGMAIWRKALTDAEIEDVVSYNNLSTGGTILKVDTTNKLSGKLSRILRAVQRLEAGA